MENTNEVVIKKKLFSKGVIAAVIFSVCFLILIIVVCMGYAKKYYYTWPESGVALELPKPPTKTGNIIACDDKTFVMEIDNFSKSKLDEYIEKCVEAGFDIDEDRKSGFSAYKQNGCQVNMIYSKNEKILLLKLSAPKEYTEIKWPEKGLGSLIPAPESLKGILYYDNENTFAVDIADTDIDGFKKYAEKCSKAGFSKGASNTKTQYSALCDTGEILTIEYIGGNRISISIEK